MPRPFVRRVALRNYKSIAACDLELGALTFLVGANGSGKSNFLDALRLVADGVASPLDHAIRERGGIDDVRRRSTGHPQRVKGSEHPWKFFAGSMSDGTLRALGVLVALGQASDERNPVRLIGIEEPESAIHPAATTVLLEALLDAASQTQVIVTSHSPDLLESREISDEQIVAVAAEEGVTVLGPLTDVGRSALREHLYSPGELLRMSQLEPREEARALDPGQLELFRELAS